MKLSTMSVLISLAACVIATPLQSLNNRALGTESDAKNEQDTGNAQAQSNDVVHGAAEKDGDIVDDLLDVLGLK
ncbi:hypothetical protein BDW74DRAFT_184065 [Aspergillus multicolor]|uniref:uncharacterized protein n=1 Tax=Aspergillus multicolor TaxID=41759 RepID=UPI003CCD7C83